MSPFFYLFVVLLFWALAYILQPAAQVVSCDELPPLPRGFEELLFFPSKQQPGVIHGAFSLKRLALRPLGTRQLGTVLFDDVGHLPLVPVHVMCHLLKNPDLLPASWRGQTVVFASVFDHHNDDVVFALRCSSALHGTPTVLTYSLLCMWTEATYVAVDLSVAQA